MTQEDERLRSLLKRAFPPIDARGPARSLLPRMRRRLDDASTRVPWWEWATAAVAVAWLFLFPESIPALLLSL